MKIFKYPLNQQGETIIDLPKGVRLDHLHVAGQRNKPMLWALVDPHADKVRHRFFSAVTGEKTPDGARYIGTFLLYKGDFVGHLFLLGEPVERGC